MQTNHFKTASIEHLRRIKIKIFTLGIFNQRLLLQKPVNEISTSETITRFINVMCI